MKLPKVRLKAEVPEDLKSELARTPWGKVLSVTPVVLTVIATMLAGLASSEMTRAQYERSLAALGVSKVVTVTSTYDHRIIQGAESGL